MLIWCKATISFIKHSLLLLTAGKPWGGAKIHPPHAGVWSRCKAAPAVTAGSRCTILGWESRAAMARTRSRGRGHGTGLVVGATSSPVVPWQPLLAGRSCFCSHPWAATTSSWLNFKREYELSCYHPWDAQIPFSFSQVSVNGKKTATKCWIYLPKWHLHSSAMLILYICCCFLSICFLQSVP